MPNKLLRHLLFICFSFISIVGYAQMDLSIGVKGGINLSSLDTTVPAGESYETLTAIHIGLFTTFKFSKLGIQPEFLFSKQGAMTNDASGNELQIDLTYQNVPVIFKVYFARFFNLQAGPQLGLLTFAQKDGSGSSTVDLKDDLKKTSLSLCLGAGVDLPMKVNFDVRYVMGLSDINDIPGENSINNNILQASIGYRLFNR